MPTVLYTLAKKERNGSPNTGERENMDLQNPMLTAEFNITSIEVGESGSIINAEGTAGKYGRVFATWVLESSGDRSGGTYYGSGRGISDDDSFVSGVFRGIWRREGGQVKIFSLDHADNGDQNLAIIEVDVRAKQAGVTVLSLNE